MKVKTEAALTKFATAERVDDEQIYRQSRMILDHLMLSHICEAMLNAVAIVNWHRQIVYCNQNFAAFAGYSKPEAIYGKRPGEVLECVHSSETPGGCGTSEPCAVCGAVNAVLEAQKGAITIKEANIRRAEGKEDANLEFKASPMQYGGELFVVISVTDISDKYRRQALERIFFHDLMNTASGLRIISEELPDLIQSTSADKIKVKILTGTRQLIEQIKEQRGLLAAENNELKPKIQPLRTRRILTEVADYYKHLDIAENRQIIIDGETNDTAFESDQTLIFRVLGNMVKNALEACKENEVVTISSKRAGKGVEFKVHNPGFIPRKVQFQIFQRAFSTKAEGRGLGTYSMKLLTENYLSGRIDFTSSETEGTCFRAWYPLNIRNLA